jgi:hypothetical protein
MNRFAHVPASPRVGLAYDEIQRSARQRLGHMHPNRGVTGHRRRRPPGRFR